MICKIQIFLTSVLMFALSFISANADLTTQSQHCLTPHQNEVGLWGYVYEDGTTAIPHSWQYCDYFRGAGYALVTTLDGYFAILQLDGSYAVSPDKNIIISASMNGVYYGGKDTGVFWLDNGDKIAFFDVTNGYMSDFSYNIVTDPWFDGDASSLLRVTKDGDTYGYVSRHTGDEVIPYIFTNINLDGFHNGYAIEKLTSNGRYAIVKEDGSFVFMPLDMKPVPGAFVEEELLLVQDTESGCYGYCNINCEWVVHPIYEVSPSYKTGISSININE